MLLALFLWLLIGRDNFSRARPSSFSREVYLGAEKSKQAH